MGWEGIQQGRRQDKKKVFRRLLSEEKELMDRTMHGERAGVGNNSTYVTSQREKRPHGGVG